MKKPLLFLAAFFACVIAYLSLRSLIGAAAAAVVAGLSASAIAAGTAGSAKAAGGAGAGVAIHLPAALGALAGAAMLVINTSHRPWPERIVLTLASYVVAYYGGLSVSEQWGLGPGIVAVAGAVCARLGAAALDTAHRLVRDADWVKSMLARRPGSKEKQ